jgi:hypothetical protein
MLKKRLSGDPALRDEKFNPMAAAMEKAGLLHTKKGTPRKNQHMKCKGNCGHFVAFLGKYKSVGFCDDCGDELRNYKAYSFLSNVS